MTCYAYFSSWKHGSFSLESKILLFYYDRLLFLLQWLYSVVQILHKHTYRHKHVPTHASSVSSHHPGMNELPGHLVIGTNARLVLLLRKKKRTQQFLWEFMQCEQNTSWRNGEPRNSSLLALLGKLHFKFLAEGFVWLAPGKLFNIFINPVVALEPMLI